MDKISKMTVWCVAVDPEKSGIVIGEGFRCPEDGQMNAVHVPFTGYGAGWQHDQFGVNVGRMKTRLPDVAARWHYEANSWACGQQDHYGEGMDEMFKFCRANYYDVLDKVLAEEVV